MNMFYKTARRNFCQYHHDFHPKTKLGRELFLLGAFDFARILFYLYLAIKVGTHLPQFLLFGRRRHINNPDYLMFSDTEFEKKTVLNK
jgi:hypothetical protein